MPLKSLLLLYELCDEETDDSMQSEYPRMPPPLWFAALEAAATAAGGCSPQAAVAATAGGAAQVATCPHSALAPTICTRDIPGCPKYQGCSTTKRGAHFLQAKRWQDVAAVADAQSGMPRAMLRQLVNLLIQRLQQVTVRLLCLASVASLHSC